MNFSFSGRTQTRTGDSHGEFIDVVTIWDFPGKGFRAYPRGKLQITENANSMDLEQRCIIKFLHIKGLKLGELLRNF
jgi:hypothetical protein